MSFTLSFVLEVLIGGCFCSVWVAFLINKIAGGTLLVLIDVISKWLNVGAIGLFLCLISVYILGWVSQYFCDLLFDNVFEKMIKESPFKKKSDFHEARGLVMQKGSKTVIDDIQMDRQLLRLSKQICLNFTIIAIVVLLYLIENLVFSLVLCFIAIIIAVVSFFQWKKRFVSVMYKFYRASESIHLLKDNEENINN